MRKDVGFRYILEVKGEPEIHLYALEDIEKGPELLKSADTKILSRDMFTGFVARDGTPLFEGDICVGKTDYRHPMGQGEGFVEQGVIEFIGGAYYWNGHQISVVFPNIMKIGNITQNPEMIVPFKNVGGALMKI